MTAARERSPRGGEFLRAMERASRRRASELLGRATELAARVRSMPPPVPLALTPDGFEVIAEVKFASPSAGALGLTPSAEAAAERARLYAGAGACAVSVLTEPSVFAGSLAHLAATADAVRVPVLRKDFLVAPLQVLEARAAGASGVLLLARLLGDRELVECLALARELGLFVLLEAFDELDLERACSATERFPGLALLVGVNARDLATLEVDRERCARLAPRLPRGVPAVAESGIAGADDARLLARAGYGLALVGSALMRAPDPAAALDALLAAGREGRAACASS